MAILRARYKAQRNVETLQTIVLSIKNQFKSQKITHLRFLLTPYMRDSVKKKLQKYSPIMTTTPLLLKMSQEKFYSNRKQRAENWKLVFMKNSSTTQQFFLKITNVLKEFICIYK